MTFPANRFPGEIDLATCVLDDPEPLAPRDPTHSAFGLGWSAPRDGLPVFPGFRRADWSPYPSAASKSAIRSFQCSVPIEMRTSPSVIPASASSSSESSLCVVVFG